LDRSYLIDLTSQLAAQQQNGWDVILVTSGAIRAGYEALDGRSTDERRAKNADAFRPTSAVNTPSPEAHATLPYKQAAAAIGQSRLMHTYTEAFAWRNVDCAQVLLTREDIADRRRLSNARNTLYTLLSLGVIPIINENDTVAVDEIKFGDNDNLAALVAVLIKANLLLILSDVEGLYADGIAGITCRGDGGNNDGTHSIPGAPIAVVECVNEAIQALAGDSAGELGTGGMRTKIEAARVATVAGIKTVIARGRRQDVVQQVVDGAVVGTTFLPAGLL
jgi:glutamate 5-kinase